MLNQIYKDASDDRLSKIAQSVLLKVALFLKSNPKHFAADSRLT